MLQFIIKILVIIFAGLLQSATWFAVIGVKPNLVMALVLAMMMFDRNWIDRLAFIAVGELMLQFGPSPDVYSFIFLGLMLLSAAIFDYLNLQQYLTLGVAMVVATAVVDIYGHVGWGIALTETAYNLVLVILAYLVLDISHGKKIFQ